MNIRYTFLILLAGGLLYGIPAVAQQAPVAPATATPDTTSKQPRQKQKRKKQQAPKTTRVVMSREVTRTTLSRRSTQSPNKLEIVIRQSGMNINNPEDLQLVGSNGTSVISGNYIGFENFELPFEGFIRFKSPNLMKTATYNREVRLVVRDPGQWVLQMDL